MMDGGVKGTYLEVMDTWAVAVGDCSLGALGFLDLHLLPKWHSSAEMASRPGILTDWPWKALGSFKGRAIFASGSPFAPVEYNGKMLVPGQANNAYIFPGLGLGLIMSGTIRVHDDMLLAASEALAEQLREEHFVKGSIYPPFKDIRNISARIAAKVAAKAYELGLATRLPQPKDLVKCAESSMYSPSYRSYR
ncbi:PREDICTED: NADP-dependent malic enzyme 4, chloroplastic-like isoform X2 [Tarenaya hassleriana]|uniref:NADP-dependent malic enzyme 4, chloroplastic-like isoform X2 n=1 Tax=Tarenaya hassleriana TaxID=28532 RepID=UPI00053C7359|nr:PREDICTED: NADP-dependent malic enzyme 4, chloroplastic-like isoform X2 [Tarenaya hassleriana]